MSKKKLPSLNLHGALLVDKPANITSAQVLRELKRLGVSKLGHGGTLDPMATGLLVVLLGQSTRLQDYVMDGRKEYIGEVLLGRSTDTLDVTGKTVMESGDKVDFSEGSLEELRNRFNGEILQVPPAFSALKVDGERSYDLARKGELVEHSARPVTVYSLDLAFDGHMRIRYRVECSKGFYVRSLARDIGGALGIPSCLASIRRTRSGFFSVSGAKPLSSLGSAEELRSSLVPLADIIAGMPRLLVPNALVDRALNGEQGIFRDLCGSMSSAPHSVFSEGGSFLGVVEHDGVRPAIRFLVPKDSVQR
jgi:tRNA pseudouridine55 synthase